MVTKHKHVTAGIAFANAPVAAVHALAYPIGTHFKVSHGLSNALMLPHVLRYNNRYIFMYVRYIYMCIWLWLRLKLCMGINRLYFLSYLMDYFINSNNSP